MSENFIKKVFLSSSYFVVNKEICKIIDPNAALLLSLLIDKYFYWKENGKLNADGSFYKKREEILDEISLTIKKRLTAQKTLQHFGFLGITKQGKKDYNLYTINWDNLQEAWVDPIAYRAKFGPEDDSDIPIDHTWVQNEPSIPRHDLDPDLGTIWTQTSARNVPITENSQRRTQTETATLGEDSREWDSPASAVADTESASVNLINLRSAILAVVTDPKRPIPDDEAIDRAVQMCKDGGVPISDMTKREFLSVCFPRDRIAYLRKVKTAKGDKINVDAWMETVGGVFERSVAQIYLADTIESTVVRKAQAPEPSVKHRNGDLIVTEEMFNNILNLPEDEFPSMNPNFDETDDDAE